MITLGNSKESALHLRILDHDKTVTRTHISYTNPEHLYVDSRSGNLDPQKVKANLKEGFNLAYDSQAGSIFAVATFNPNPDEVVAHHQAQLGENYRIQERHHNGKSNTPIAKPKVYKVGKGIFLLKKYDVFKSVDGQWVRDPVPLVIAYLPGENYFNSTLTKMQTCGKKNIGENYGKNYGYFRAAKKQGMLHAIQRYIRGVVKKDMQSSFYDDSEENVSAAKNAAILGPNARYFVVDPEKAQFVAYPVEGHAKNQQIECDVYGHPIVVTKAGADEEGELAACTKNLDVSDAEPRPATNSPPSYDLVSSASCALFAGRDLQNPSPVLVKTPVCSVQFAEV